MKLTNDKKLELTLCGMLLYGLEVYSDYFSSENKTYKLVVKNETVSYRGGIEINEAIQYCKPLLHSLSKLTEPVLEGGNIPIVELAKLENGNEEIYDFKIITKDNCFGVSYFLNDELRYGFSYSKDTKSFSVVGIDPKNVLLANNQLELFEKLKEWHFNIYDLPKEMYIEKQTIL